MNNWSPFEEVFYDNNSYISNITPTFPIVFWIGDNFSNLENRNFSLDCDRIFWINLLRSIAQMCLLDPYILCTTFQHLLWIFQQEVCSHNHLLHNGQLQVKKIDIKYFFKSSCEILVTYTYNLHIFKKHFNTCIVQQKMSQRLESLFALLQNRFVNALNIKLFWALLYK